MYYQLSTKSWKCCVCRICNIILQWLWHCLYKQTRIQNPLLLLASRVAAMIKSLQNGGLQNTSRPIRFLIGFVFSDLDFSFCLLAFVSRTITDDCDVEWIQLWRNVMLLLLLRAQTQEKQKILPKRLKPQLFETGHILSIIHIILVLWPHCII